MSKYIFTFKNSSNEWRDFLLYYILNYNLDDILVDVPLYLQ